MKRMLDYIQDLIEIREERKAKEEDTLDMPNFMILCSEIKLLHQIKYHIEERLKDEKVV